MATETKRNVTKHSVDNVVVVWLALPMLCLCLACATDQPVGERERERDEEIRLHSPELSWASRLRSWLRKESRGYRGVVLPQPKSSRAWHTATANYRLPVLYQLRSLSFPSVSLVSFSFFPSISLALCLVPREIRDLYLIWREHCSLDRAPCIDSANPTLVLGLSFEGSEWFNGCRSVKRRLMVYTSFWVVVCRSQKILYFWLLLGGCKR